MEDNKFHTIKFENNVIKMIDQRKLPKKEEYFICKNYEHVIFAIKEMVIRGAPAIGVAAGFGIALFCIQSKSKDVIINNFEKICKEFAKSRPTAVNLFWAIKRMKKKFEATKAQSLAEIQDTLLSEATNIYNEDILTNRLIGEHGNKIISKKSKRCNILTHCNAGALATAGYGTALGVIRTAHDSGKNIHVFVDETRPFLQGARLTAWELMKEKIPCTLICDNMAGFLMNKNIIDVIVVGADRIAANGDTANKIGTYSLSVLAKENNVPFYVAAPISTFDMTIKNGKEIPIEERSGKEITHIFSEQISPDNIQTFNPAFDVTPNRNITGIITEKGIITEPFQENIRSVINVD
jgi:methylthioribose-1-phosphate isomerase